MLFGLLEGKSVLLSEIGRSLDEPVKLIHTERRLSRQLSSPRFDNRLVRSNYLYHAQVALTDGRKPYHTIAVDLTDIQKPYAKKMGGLRKVRDGSKKVMGNGYEVLAIEAVGEHQRRMPLALELVPNPSGSVTAATARFVLDRIAAVKGFTSPKATWVFDRGFDGRRVIDKLDALGLTFAIRLNTGKTARGLWVGDGDEARYLLVHELIGELELRFEHEGPCKKWRWMTLGWRSVRLPTKVEIGKGRTSKPDTRWWSVVVARGEGAGQPLAILTKKKVRNADDARNVVDAYMNRWAVEDEHRFLKQTFDLENIRVMTWGAIQRMLLMVMLAYGYLGYMMHFFRRKAVKAASSFKAFGRVPKFLYYRLAGRVRELFRYKFHGPP